MLSLAVCEAELLQIKYLMHWQCLAGYNANHCHKSVLVVVSVIRSLTSI